MFSALTQSSTHRAAMWRRTDAGPDRDDLRAARIVVLAATALFLLVVTRWRPWDLFARGGFSADFYDEQARSFLRGRLHVRPEVAGNEGFLVDGRTYLYYGPFLALVRVPFALVDWFAGRLTRLSLVLGYASYCTAAFHLIRLRTTERVRTALFVAIAAASPALFLTGWVSVYHETEMWAATFAVWAAIGALRFVQVPSRRNALVCAGAVVAATLTRAPIGIGIALGVAAVALLRWRREWVPVLAAAGGGIGLHVVVNLAKFGSLFDLPADRQALSLQNAGRAEWFAGNDNSFFGLRFLETTVVHYLRPDTIRFERLLPLVRFGPRATDRGSYPMESITPSSSLTATATALTIAAVVGLVVLARRREWTWFALTGGGVVAAVPSFAIGFLANRYLVDMLPMLLIPAAAAVATIPLPRWVFGVAIALVAWGTWSNVALATWVQNLKEPGFTAWRYSVDDALFGDPAPRLIDSPTSPVPDNGVVAVDVAGDSCRSVYIAEDGEWIALEHAQGERRLNGVLTGPGVVATGDDWELVATAGDGTLRFALGDDVEGDPLRWDGEPVEVTVVIDDVTRTTEVTVDGEPALYTFTTPPLPMQPGPAFTPDDDPGDDLCRQLRPRL